MLYHQKKKFKKNYPVLLFIFSILLIVYYIIFNVLFSSIHLNYKRNLSSYKDSSSNDKDAENIDFFSFVLLASYVIFIFLSLYIICQLKILSDKTEGITLEIFKFMYMSNNGYLLVGIIDTSISKAGAAIGCTVISSIILTVGTIIFLVKFIKVIMVSFFDVYFRLQMVILWLQLPFIFVWPFMGLTDPCCYRTTYTITQHADGTITSDRDWVILTNKIMWGIKRLAFMISTLLYYFFFFMLMLIWGLVKLILLLIDIIKESCFQNQAINNEDEKAENIENQNNPPVTVVGYEVSNSKNNNNIEKNNKKIISFKRQKSTFVTRNSSINPTNQVNSIENFGRRQSYNINISTKRTFIKGMEIKENIDYENKNNNQNLNNNLNENLNENINQNKKINLSIVINQNIKQNNTPTLKSGENGKIRKNENSLNNQEQNNQNYIPIFKPNKKRKIRKSENSLNDQEQINQNNIPTLKPNEKEKIRKSENPLKDQEQNNQNNIPALELDEKEKIKKSENPLNNQDQNNQNNSQTLKVVKRRKSEAPLNNQNEIPNSNMDIRINKKYRTNKIIIEKNKMKNIGMSANTINPNIQNNINDQNELNDIQVDYDIMDGKHKIRSPNENELQNKCYNKKANVNKDEDNIYQNKNYKKDNEIKENEQYNNTEEPAPSIVGENGESEIKESIHESNE